MRGMCNTLGKHRHCEAAIQTRPKQSLRLRSLSRSRRLLRFARNDDRGIPLQPPRNNSGFILLLTLVLMAALSAAVGALILSLTTDFRNVKVRSESTKAFYLAEAGVADTIKRLKSGELVVSDSSSAASTFNGTLGEGT